MTEDPECAQVQEFRDKFNMPITDRPCLADFIAVKDRLDHLREELAELEYGVFHRDLPKKADALIDLVYVAKGLALMLGLGSAWKKLFDDVHEANMRKVPGISARGQAHDVIKSEDWVGPKTEEILKAHGWMP